jgi:uncharacterized protein (TIGR03083 family)
MDFEPAPLLARITAATDQLLATVATFDDADVRQPSRLPGWTRGHVLTHIARNADAQTRMLTWARTGIEAREYGPPPVRTSTETSARGGPATHAAAEKPAHVAPATPAATSAGDGNRAEKIADDAPTSTETSGPGAEEFTPVSPLTPARAGDEAPDQAGVAARAAEIEAGHARPARELLTDVRDSAARFAAAYRAMPAPAWTRRLRWTSGKQRPAYRAADSRLFEVLVHHVDLRAAYGPDNWPPPFVTDALATVTSAFRGRADPPALHLIATDTGTEYRLTPTATEVVRDTAPQLLAWLLGRSDTRPNTLPFLF